MNKQNEKEVQQILKNNKKYKKMNTKEKYYNKRTVVNENITEEFQ